MLLGQQSELVMSVTIVIYFLSIAWLLLRGRSLLAGIASLLISFLPLWRQAKFTDSEANGFGILPILRLPYPYFCSSSG
jgi:hypothetical protein